jgi:site-specific DNA-methyltransferase (adenine-specific)
VQRWGTGAINVGACRIGDAGRWPANLLLDEDAAAMLDAEVGEKGGGYGTSGGDPDGHGIYSGSFPRGNGSIVGYGDSGGPSRFFYTSKASRREREAGLEHRAPEQVGDGRETPANNAYQRGKTARLNTHPTVKPLDLMRWLVRLVAPPEGIILDPFTGSGSTGCAAALEGLPFLGLEISEEYAEISRARIAHWTSERDRSQG